MCTMYTDCQPFAITIFAQTSVVRPLHLLATHSWGVVGGCWYSRKQVMKWDNLHIEENKHILKSPQWLDVHQTLLFADGTTVLRKYQLVSFWWQNIRLQLQFLWTYHQRIPVNNNRTRPTDSLTILPGSADHEDKTTFRWEEQTPPIPLNSSQLKQDKTHKKSVSNVLQK